MEARHRAAADKEGKRRGCMGMVLVAAVAGLVLFVGVPFYRSCTTRHQWCCTEVGSALNRIEGGARQYFIRDHWASNGNPIQVKTFPQNIQLTPASGPPCGKQLTPIAAWDAAGWGPLHFALTEPHYLAYQFQSTGTGTAAVYTARAHGDMDCDKIWSTFEYRGHVDHDGSVKAEWFMANEWE